MVKSVRKKGTNSLTIETHKTSNEKYSCRLHVELVVQNKMILFRNVTCIDTTNEILLNNVL